MSEYVVTDTELTAMANSIRAKTGDSSAIEFEADKGFADAIADIPSGGGSTAELIPVMTSNTTPSGVASASSVFTSDFSAFRAFDGINTTSSMSGGWLAGASDNAPYLQYEFASASKCDSMTIYTANNSTTATRTVTIQGRKNNTWENCLKTGSTVTLTFQYGTYGSSCVKHDIELNGETYDAIKITGNEPFYMGTGRTACTFDSVQVYTETTWNGVPLLQRSAWEALTRAQKQAYGLVAVQDYNTGYTRGVLYCGSELPNTWIDLSDALFSSYPKSGSGNMYADYVNNSGMDQTVLAINCSSCTWAGVQSTANIQVLDSSNSDISSAAIKISDDYKNTSGGRLSNTIIAFIVVPAGGKIKFSSSSTAQDQAAAYIVFSAYKIPANINRYYYYSDNDRGSGERQVQINPGDSLLFIDENQRYNSTSLITVGQILHDGTYYVRSESGTTEAVLVAQYIGDSGGSQSVAVSNATAAATEIIATYSFS